MVQARNVIFLIASCAVLGLFAASCVGTAWGSRKGQIRGKVVDGEFILLFFFKHNFLQSFETALLFSERI